jgi:hypothetical protein
MASTEQSTSAMVFVFYLRKINLLSLDKQPSDDANLSELRKNCKISKRYKNT